MLACLTAGVGHRVKWSELTTALWGDTPPPSARAALQVHVSGVRSLLEPDRVPRSPGRYLRTHGDSYTLDLRTGELDWTRFTRFGEYARFLRATGRPDDALKLLKVALELWRGPAFEDIAEPTPVVSAHARWLDDLRLQAEEDMFAASLAAGRHTELTGTLDRALARQPFRERRAALLMLALYRAGRQREALSIYDRTRRLLVEEVGCEPGPELARLYDMVLSHDSRLDQIRLDPVVKGFPQAPVRPVSDDAQLLIEGPDIALLELEALLTMVGTVTARESGSLRMAGDPEQLGGILESELGQPIGEMASVRHLLIGDTTPPSVSVAAASDLEPRPALTGRKQELRSLQKWISGRGRVASVVGPVGVGKSSLATALRLPPGGPKSRIQITFSDSLDIEAAMEVLMGAAGVDRRPLGDALTDLARALEGHLLILDDHDRAGPALEELVGELLARSESLRVLTTGRRPWAGPGHVLVLEPLPLPAPGDSTEAVLAAPSVALLLERMGRLPTGTGSTEARDLSALVNGLDGLPLAIELVAPAAAALGARAVVERLERTPAVISQPRAEGRHASLDTALAWAVADLRPRAREVLARLSVFAGGFGLDAAETVAAGGEVTIDDVAVALAELVNAWLVSNRDPAGYRMLESTRLVARSWLERSDPEGLTRERHARHTVARLMALGPTILGRGGTAARREVEQALADLADSLEWMFGEGDDPDSAVDVLADLTFFWFSSGRITEGRRRYRRALESGRGSPAGRVRCLVGEAFLAWWQGDYGAVRATLTEVVETGGAEHIPEVAAMTDVAWASLAWVDLRLDDAARHLDRAMEVAASRGLEWELASATTMAANVAWYRGDYRLAVELYRRASEVGSRLRNPLLSAVADRGEALMVALEGRLEEALILADEVLAQGRILADPLSEAQSRTFAGLVRLENGDLSVAVDLLVEALDRAVGPFDVMTFLLAGPGLAECARRVGDVECAVVLASWAGTVAQLSGIPMAPVETDRCSAALSAEGLEPGSVQRAAHRGRGLTPEAAASLASECRSQWSFGGA